MSGTKVQIKYGYGRPAEGSLKKAEIAVDLDDKSLWTADENGTIVRVGHDTSDIEIDVDDLQSQIDANKNDINNNANNIGNNANDIKDLQGQINANKNDISENANNIGNNANDIQDLKNDFENHDHALDDLSDVNAGSPTRDDLIIFNGTNWVASEWAFIDTALRFKGGISPSAQAPANPEGGDLYVFDSNGTISSSWGAIAGQVVETGKFVGYAAGTNNRWYLLGQMADVGVVKVSPGTGIDVDDSKPSEPVVSIDRDEVDKWYAAKGDIVWKQNGDDIYYNDGNVGIGTDNPATYAKLTVESSGLLSRSTANNVNCQINTLGSAGLIQSSTIAGESAPILFYIGGNESMRIDSEGRVGIGKDRDIVSKLQISNPDGNNDNRAIRISNDVDQTLDIGITSGEGSAGSTWIRNPNGGNIDFQSELKTTMRIDAQGRVGIGGEPSRSAGDIAKDAKDTLARWKSSFDARLREEPKADKKAVTLEITGGEFDTFPTESKLVERLTERNIGGGSAKLQVAGDGYFSGSISAQTIYGRVDDVGDHIKAITPTQIAAWDAGTGGGGGSANIDARISDEQIVHWDQAWNWGNHATAGYQPAGNYADANHTHSQYLTAIAGGNGTKVTGTKVEMSGSYNGTFTATGDIVAYSDARLKENVETLDGSKVFDMRGVSFTRDGKESSGVIAQELQKIAPELVHDDGEHLGVAYGNLVGYLIEAVKELKAEVEALKRG